MKQNLDTVVDLQGKTMDAIITYVDGSDPLWQKDYENCFKTPPLAKRFRDWGTLPFLLRSIEKNLPFVDNVYLVLSGESQIPDWVNTENLKIVLHKDIIPEQFLPNFNSTAIEMFLHKIPSLKERFLYFNDDFFPLKPCSEDLFFEGGKINTNFSTNLFVKANYKQHVRNGDRLARKVLGKKPSLFYKRAQHTCYPMLKSISEELFTKCESEILKSVSAVRANYNMNFTLFLSYAYHSGRAVSKRIPSKFLSLALHTSEEIAQSILEPAKEIACINDVSLSNEKFIEYKTRILDAFLKRLPEKSRFEK